MLTQTFVNRTYFFFPFGNIPAGNLLRDFGPAQQDQIRFLLLGCGDVRNLLFTLWSQGPDSKLRASLITTGEYKLTFTDQNVTYDFTTCDYEPAILGKTFRH